MAVAQRIIWFMEPDVVVNMPTKFLCYLMEYGTDQDVLTAQQYFTESDFKTALDNSPPGILSRRSWAYWNLMLNHDSEKPMPKRW
ncbi:hypothetical protein PN498_13210 [Oscillatoria sp. CS-180]|nr:hypothetical protein [Oscillatoria sp. CS-180]